VRVAQAGKDSQTLLQCTTGGFDVLARDDRTQHTQSGQQAAALNAEPVDGLLREFPAATGKVLPIIAPLLLERAAQEVEKPDGTRSGWRLEGRDVILM
jgi:hypothetical protein